MLRMRLRRMKIGSYLQNISPVLPVQGSVWYQDCIDYALLIIGTKMTVGCDFWTYR